MMKWLILAMLLAVAFAQPPPDFMKHKKEKPKASGRSVLIPFSSFSLSRRVVRCVCGLTRPTRVRPRRDHQPVLSLTAPSHRSRRRPSSSPSSARTASRSCRRSATARPFRRRPRRRSRARRSCSTTRTCTAGGARTATACTPSSACSASHRPTPPRCFRDAQHPLNENSNDVFSGTTRSRRRLTRRRARRWRCPSTRSRRCTTPSASSRMCVGPRRLLPTRKSVHSTVFSRARPLAPRASFLRSHCRGSARR